MTMHVRKTDKAAPMLWTPWGAMPVTARPADCGKMPADRRRERRLERIDWLRKRRTGKG